MAPSPTGALHLGGIRTALYNYLFAKKYGGDFILRIEDTDAERFVPGAEEYIIDAFRWLGIEPNEGVGFGDGPHAPYRQSDRKPIYREYVDKLIASGHAYYAFDEPETLVALRKQAEAQKRTWKYDAVTRLTLENSLTLSPDEVKKRLSDGIPYVIRFKMPPNEQVVFEDIIRGTITVDTITLDDKVLFKSDGMPTYHLAVVVDDHLMEISHVIRGEEWLPSAPLHVLTYRALGWPMPEWAHLPLILGPNGKLSKRDGDKYGFPVYPLRWTDPETGITSSGYKEAGYLPEAVLNFLLLLGWAPSDNQEVFSLAEMVEGFSLERVGKSGAKFDLNKATWIQHQHMMELTTGKLAAEVAPLLLNNGISSDLNYLFRVCELIKDELVFPQDILKYDYLFVRLEKIDTDALTKKWKPESGKLIGDFCAVLENLEDFSAAGISTAFQGFIAGRGVGSGAMMPILRILLTGRTTGPATFEIAGVLGREETVGRLRASMEMVLKMV